MKLNHETKVQEDAVEDNTVQCPQCDAVQDEAECFVGQLGWLTYFNCRYCGWLFSQSPLSRSIEEAGK